MDASSEGEGLYEVSNPTDKGKQPEVSVSNDNCANKNPMGDEVPVAELFNEASSGMPVASTPVAQTCKKSEVNENQVR